MSFILLCCNMKLLLSETQQLHKILVAMVFSLEIFFAFPVFSNCEFEVFCMCTWCHLTQVICQHSAASFL